MGEPPRKSWFSFYRSSGGLHTIQQSCFWKKNNLKGVPPSFFSWGEKLPIPKRCICNPWTWLMTVTLKPGVFSCFFNLCQGPLWCRSLQWTSFGAGASTMSWKWRRGGAERSCWSEKWGSESTAFCDEMISFWILQLYISTWCWKRSRFVLLGNEPPWRTTGLVIFTRPSHCCPSNWSWVVGGWMVTDEPSFRWRMVP